MHTCLATGSCPFDPPRRGSSPSVIRPDQHTAPWLLSFANAKPNPVGLDAAKAAARNYPMLECATLGRLRLQHWEAEAPNAIMGWTMFQPRREQWTRQRYQRAPRKACAAARN